MSTITALSREIGADGVRRYRTTVKVLVHSHNTSGVIDLSNSIVAFQANKTLKSTGSCSFALTAEHNWLNLIYPNDYINVYVDRADGQGWTRTFFGFVDHVEETIQTEANGTPNTSYQIQCSDFQKAFERTQIYFNPHVAARADFNGGFVGTPNIGGLALMTRGVRLNGTPADLVLNVTLLLMGFGSQFILPTSYNPRLIDRVRRARADFILGRLSEDARRQIMDQGGYAAALENARQQSGATNPVNALIDPDSTHADAILLAERARTSNAMITTLGGSGSGPGVESSRGSRERGVEAYNILNTTVQGFPPTLLDIMDIFTFVERQAIDGYVIGAPMWERQGDVMSFLRFVSNEVINELYFDLRPVSRDGGLTAGTDFSRDLDDIAGNEGSGNVPNGILYQPAIIMREYPFSTIQNLDLSDISLTLRSQVAPGGATVTTGSENLGRMYFGAIFSDQPNIPGRHIIRVPNINPEDLALGTAQDAASKHVDVVVINDQEIITSKYARSDSDHYNLFEFYSDAMLGNDARFFMQDLLPIITPIHVVRHGLRVRSLTTRFGRFSLDTVNRQQPQPQQPENPPEENVAPTAPPTTPAVQLPIEHVPGVKGYVSTGNEWHYRRRVNRHEHAAFNGSHAVDVPLGDAIWRFHNGVDFAAPRGEPVKAVRDGYVVCASLAREDASASPGFDGYGGTVIIYHPAISPTAPDGQTANDAVFTLYAHLDSIASNLVQGNAEGKVNRMSPELISGGRYHKVEVHAGDVIGTVGSTGFRDSNMGPHLHLEVIKKTNNMVYPSMNRTLTPDFLVTDSQKQPTGWAPSTARVSSAEPGLPDESAMRSQNPLRVFSEWGLELPHGRNASEIGPRDPDPPAISDGEPQVYTGDAGEEVEDQPLAPGPSPQPAETQDTNLGSTVRVGHVDTPTTRRQLARWALLNDHWYQHNLEYLSGTIDMHGAPEVRVGYRADLVDRNLSFYVEGVSHNWSYGKDMRTTLHVTRGQPSNPYPCYVLPALQGFTPTDTQRLTNSRLAQFFVVPDPIAVRRALKLDRVNTPSVMASSLAGAVRRSPQTNEVDSAGEDSGGDLGARYNENIVEASSITSSEDTIQLQQTLDNTNTGGLEGTGTTTSAVQTNPQTGIPGSQIVQLEPINIETP